MIKPAAPRTASQITRLTALIAILMVAILLAGCIKPATNHHQPRVTMWAWHGKQDLSFNHNAGVAFWAGTIVINQHGIYTNPRRSSLVTRASQPTSAVVRIEAYDPEASLKLAYQVEKVVQEILQLLPSPQGFDLQIDFDATLSQRDSYRKLLELLSNQHRGKLTITALTSWCFEPDWLDTLPIEYAVPMVFRLGPDSQQYRQRMARAGHDLVQPCKEAVGVSWDEPISLSGPWQHVYLFPAGDWNAEKYQRMNKWVKNSDKKRPLRS